MKHETLVLNDLWEAMEPFLPRDHPAPVSSPDRVERTIGAASLGGGADAGMAARVSSHRHVERQADFLQGLLHLARALLCVRFVAPTG